MNNIPSQWTSQGFMQRFDELLPLCHTYLSTYMQAEEEHRALFGRQRYASYDAFRMTRKQMLSKR